MPLIGFDDIGAFDGAGDVVVVGSGFAGQAVVGRLAARGFRVLLLEQGSPRDPMDPGGDDYRLDVTGLPYAALGARLASFGGTSNHWHGDSHPLSPRVFEPRGGAPGWPIPYRDFAAYLPEAANFLRIKSFEGRPTSPYARK